MADTKICPECRSSLPAAAEYCSFCPHSFHTAEHGVQQNRSGSGHFASLLWLIFFAGAIYGVWKLVAFVFSYADKEMNTAGAAAPYQKPTGNESLAEVISQMQQVEGGSAAAGRPAKPYSTRRPEDEAEASDAVMISSSRDRDRHAPEVKEWRLRGVVYDLVTLRAVPRATLVILDPGLTRRYETSTDSTGRYRTTVPVVGSPGYRISIRHPDYARPYLNPGTEGVSSKPEAERRQLARELSHGLDSPYTVEAYGAAPVVTDFYVAPLRQ